MRLTVAFLYILLVGVTTLSAQCSYTYPTTINDSAGKIDTTRVYTTVDGVISNDLSKSTQHVCAVKLSFTHDFLGDLYIDLVSPAGQRVRMVGPGVRTSAVTSLVKWDVQFVACKIPVFPDPGYSGEWNNNQVWVGPKTYTGTYHPYQGCFEDQNVGPVNGLWTVEYIDQSDNGDGEITGVEITFCESAGIECNPCAPGTHTLTGGVTELCQNDPNVFIDPVYIDRPDDAVYSYAYLAYKNGVLEGVLEKSEIATLDAGLHTLCGVSYRSIDRDRLLGLSKGMTNEEVEQYINENSICWSISEACIELTIKSAPEVVTVQEEICEGNGIEVNGKIYSEAGKYQIVTDAAVCDSISFLELSVIPSPYSLVASVDSLSCDAYFSILTIQDVPSTAEINWSTSDGEFQSGVDKKTIFAQKAGAYTATIKDEMCEFKQTINVYEKTDFVYIKLVNDTISCVQPEVEVSIESDISIDRDSISWTSTLPFTEKGNNIVVNQAGLYILDVTKNGCSTRRFTNVAGDQNTSGLSIKGVPLTCKDPKGELQVINATGIAYNYRWYLGTSLLGTNTSLSVDQAGDYYVVASGANDCTDTLKYTVENHIRDIRVDLVIDPITCKKRKASVSYTANVDTSRLTTLWTAPDNSTISENAFTTTLEGTYTLFVKDNEGCELETTFLLQNNDSPPDFRIVGADFECSEDSLQLQLQGVQSGEKVRWNGPFLSSTQTNPWVKELGLYRVTVTAENGCSATKSYEVTAGPNVPEINFSYEKITCDNSSVTVTPDITSSITFEWFDPSGNVTTGNSYDVDRQGIYRVTYTDAATGCVGSKQLSITEDKDNEINSVSAEELNCTNSISKLSIDSENPLRTVIWKDSLGRIVADSVGNPGRYFLEYVLDKNGCKGADTIDVIQSLSVPNLIVETDTITCKKPSVSLGAVVLGFEDVSITWKDENDKIYEGDTITTRMDGRYEVVAMAPNTCADTAYIEVYNDSLKASPMLTIDGDIMEISCVDSFLQLIAFVDTSITDSRWEGPSFKSKEDLVATVQSGGVYRFVAITENGCEGVASIEVGSTVKIPEYEIVKDTVNCKTPVASFEVVTAQNNIITWDNPNINGYKSSTDSAEVYTFTLKNELECTVSDKVVILLDTLHPVASIEKSNDLNCAMTSTDLNVLNYNDNTTYTWSGPATDNVTDTLMTVFIPGLFMLKAENQNGCFSVDSVTVTQDVEAPVINAPDRLISCSAGKTALLVEHDVPLISYYWTGVGGYESNDPEPLVVKTGIYRVTVTAENACSGTDTVLVSTVTEEPVLEVRDFYLPCDGSQVVIIPSEVTYGAKISWFGPDNIFGEGDVFRTDREGTYEAIAIDENQCIVRDSFKVIDKPIYPKYSTKVSPVYCTKLGILSITDYDDGALASWFGPDSTFIGNSIETTAAGQYKVIVTGRNACKDTSTVNLSDETQNLDIEIELQSPYQCENSRLYLYVNVENDTTAADFDYEWTSENSKILNGADKKRSLVDGGGIYYVNVTNTETGCSNKDTLLVEKEEQTFNDVTIQVTPPTCRDFANASIQISELIGGFEPYTVVVDSNYYGTTNNIQYLASGDHVVTIIDSIGCELTYQVNIYEGFYPTVELQDDLTIYFGDSIVINPLYYPDSSKLTVTWEPGTLCDGCKEFVLTPTESQEIYVNVGDENGCEYRDTLIITVNTNKLEIFPNIFSPNGDGQNDYFYMPYTKGIEQLTLLSIYDWDGKKVFEASDIPIGEQERGWDGRLNGEYANQGVYMYEATLLKIDGTMVRTAGDVTLVR